MRWPAALLTLAVLVTAFPGASAQAMEFAQAYQVRGGLGDVSTFTSHPTPADPTLFAVEQTFTIRHVAGTADKATLTVPAGATLRSATTTGSASWLTQDARQATLDVPANATAGDYTLRLLSTQPYTGGTLGLGLQPPAALGSQAAVVILYLAPGLEASGPGTHTVLGSANPSDTRTIHLFEAKSGELGQSPWYTFHPAAASPAANAPIPWLLLAGAFLLGCIVWALLVGQGMVQKRSRRQVATVAAHVEAASQDPPAVLEAKKRFLMGALKDVELAKQAKELEPEVYDAVKADFKRQAVTVMRALEQAPPK